MKRLLFIAFVLGVICSIAYSARAATILFPLGGGTGTSSPSGILYGTNANSPLQTVIIGPNLTFSAGTLSATAGSGSFPFAQDTNYGQVVYSTSTPTLWFKSGLFASSTNSNAGLAIGASSSGRALQVINSGTGPGLWMQQTGTNAFLITAICMTENANCIDIAHNPASPTLSTTKTFSIANNNNARGILALFTNMGTSKGLQIDNLDPTDYAAVVNSQGFGLRVIGAGNGGTATPFIVQSGLATTTIFQINSAGTASTTGLTISGLGSGSTQCLQISGAGAVSGTGAGCGSGSSFAYPFSAFNGIGTTTALIFSASTTIGNGTVTGGLTIAGTATTTNLNITSVTGTQCLHAIGGVVLGTGSDCGSGGSSFAYPFVTATDFNVTTQSTTTAPWFKAGLFASSTAPDQVWVDQLSIGSTTSGTLATSTDYGNFVVKGNASTTNLTVSGLGGTGSNGLAVIQANGVMKVIGIPLAVSNGGTGVNTLGASQLLYGNGTNVVASVATSTVSLTGPLNGIITAVGASNSLGWSGLATTSALTTGQLLMATGVSGVSSVATGTVSCSGSVSCTPFTVIGSGTTISGAASGNTGTLTTETPTGTINGTNTVFTTVNQPALVELNGGYQTGGGTDYTLTGTGPYTITFVNAPPTGSVLVSLYGNAVSNLLTQNNWWLALQNFVNASTSQFTATSTVWFTSLGTPAGAFLAVDGNGKVIATTTPAGGAGNPSGSLTNLQFFDTGTTFGGATNLDWLKGESALTLGTSTSASFANLTIGTSTRPQLALVDNSKTSAQWNFRSVGGFLYLATSSPGTFATSSLAAMTIAPNGSIQLPEFSIATSTNMTVDWTAGNQQLIKYGASAVTISFSNVTAGTAVTVETCTNTGTTGGALTFNAHFSGGVQPGNTTTSNQCDFWFFRGTLGTTTTPYPVLTGMVSGVQ